MKDYLVASIVGVAAVLLLLLSVWNLSAYNLASSCEKLGGFYIDSKVYKCEIAK
jgi:hypothetical protein